MDLVGELVQPVDGSADRERQTNAEQMAFFFDSAVETSPLREVEKRTFDEEPVEPADETRQLSRLLLAGLARAGIVQLVLPASSSCSRPASNTVDTACW
jgi:hypothetical protein